MDGKGPDEPPWWVVKRTDVTMTRPDYRQRKAAQRIGTGDVNLAKQAIKRSDDFSDDLIDQFEQTDDDEWVFHGTADERRAFRRAMKDWEDDVEYRRAKSLYDARYNLQFIRCTEDDDE